MKACLVPWMNSEKLIKSAEPEFQLLPFSVRAKDQVPRHPDLLATGHHREGGKGSNHLFPFASLGQEKNDSVGRFPSAFFRNFILSTFDGERTKKRDHLCPWNPFLFKQFGDQERRRGRMGEQLNPEEFVFFRPACP